MNTPVTLLAGSVDLSKNMRCCRGSTEEHQNAKATTKKTNSKTFHCPELPVNLPLDPSNRKQFIIKKGKSSNPANGGQVCSFCERPCCGAQPHGYQTG